MPYYMRWRPGDSRVSRIMHLNPDHPAVRRPDHPTCPGGCGEPFKWGDAVRLVAIGPDDDESRSRLLAGRSANVIAVLAHANCVALDGLLTTDRTDALHEVAEAAEALLAADTPESRERLRRCVEELAQVEAREGAPEGRRL